MKINGSGESEKTNPIQTQSNPIQSQSKPKQTQNKPNQTQFFLTQIPQVPSSVPSSSQRHFGSNAGNIRWLLHFCLANYPIFVVFNQFHPCQLVSFHLFPCFFETDHKISFASPTGLPIAIFH